jgi:hypothetical protein
MSGDVTIVRTSIFNTHLAAILQHYRNFSFCFRQGSSPLLHAVVSIEMPPYYFACERCTYINSGNMKLKGSSLVVRLLLLVSASTFVAQQQLMVSSWMLMDSLPLPIKSRRQRSLRHMISTSSETSATQTTCLQQLPQTDQDRNLERWFRDQGILLGNDYRRVQISTSADRSVGGRGLFLTSNFQNDIPWSPSSSVIAHQGDILAYIPGHLVLLPSNMQATFPCLFHDNNTQKGHAEFSWQSILTTYVWKALYENPRITSQSSPASSPDWRSWIETWSTDRQTSSSNNIQNVDDDLIDGPQLPKALHEYSPARIETMARQCHATTAQVRELIDAKYQTFQADWENVQEFIATRQQPKNYDERKQSSSSRQRRRHDFAELYSLVLSRTSNLGPEWGNQMGE